MGWNRCQEVANTKPLFLAIYATIIVGVVFSSFYVFSAMSSAKSAVDSNTSWLSSPSPSIASMCIFFPFSARTLLVYYFNVYMLLLCLCYNIFNVSRSHLNLCDASTNSLGFRLVWRFSCTDKDILGRNPLDFVF